MPKSIDSTQSTQLSSAYCFRLRNGWQCIATPNTPSASTYLYKYNGYLGITLQPTWLEKTQPNNTNTISPATD